MRSRFLPQLIGSVTMALIILGGDDVNATTTINLAAGDVTGLAEASDAYNNNTDNYVINLFQSTYTLTSPLPQIARLGSALGGRIQIASEAHRAADLW